MPAMTNQLIQSLIIIFSDKKAPHGTASWGFNFAP
jgi:hypothetical protein